ncbi:hypothetical protein ACN28E_37295 [Archangium lansingense]|uniref:hypothetical protein n=1 Tax=Archangium lansingense TaxID=2995310 RepID=UPI003B816D1B
MKRSMMKCAALAFVVAPILGACGPELVGEGGGGGDELAVSSAALTNVDPCAMDLTSNATGHLATEGASEDYQRAAAWINAICPASGKDRTTTILDFWASGIHNGFSYRFMVQPGFWEAANASECVNLKMATRIQRRSTATGEWEDVKYLEQAGQWIIDFSKPNLGYCSAPYFDYTRSNYKDYYSTETNMYRVRTWAKQYDGSFATVWIRGFNIGN